MHWVYVLVIDHLYKLVTKAFKRLLVMHGMSVDVHSLMMRKGPGSWTNKSASYTTFMYVCIYISTSPGVKVLITQPLNELIILYYRGW